MLQVENLSKTYRLKDREIEALKNISFTLKPGEILGLVGKSGGGKSTLMKILRGMESFERGRILLDGLIVTPESDDETKRKQMAITAIHLQRDFALWTESALKNVVRRIYSRETGYEILPIPENHNYDQLYQEALYYLRLVGLEKKANHLATVLSGGEKQRLLIARQLAKKPKILLLDEPATMSCPATKQEVLDAIKNAGSIFLGKYCPEALGDYYAGSNHTLPTGGTAKFSSPLSVDNFVKKSSYIYYTGEALRAAAGDVAAFAGREELAGHARSITIRCEDTPDL